MRYISLILFFFIACTSSKSENLTKAEKDAMVLRFNKRMNGYFINAKDDSATMLLAAMSDTVEKVDYNRLRFFWTLMRAQWIYYKQDFDSLRVLHDSLFILSKKEDITKKDLLNFYLIFGNQLREMGNHDSALIIVTEAHLLAKQIDTNRLAETNTDLAATYNRLGDMENVRKYALEAIKRVKNEPEIKRFAAVELYEYYAGKGQMDSALYYQNIFLTDTFTTLRPLQRAGDLESVGSFLVENGKAAEGLEMIIRAKSIFDSIGATTATTYLNLAVGFGGVREFDKAFSFLDSAKKILPQENSPYLERIRWQVAADLYKQLPDYKKMSQALDSALARYMIETDSSLASYGRETEAKYAGREKDRQIATLALSNQISQQVQRQQKLIIGVMIVAIGAIAFSAVLLWRRNKLQHQLRMAYLQQKVLQSQMQPHFVLNILSVLKGYIRGGDQQKAISFLSQFGRVTEQNLHNAQAQLITLGEELAAINNYLALQAMQLDPAFSFEIIRGDDLEEDDIYIPPMMVQPFVENAVIHGISGIKHPGLVRVSVDRQGELLKFVVEDNGRGLPADRRVKVNRLHAIEIVSQRLHLLRRSNGRARGEVEVKDKKEEGGKGVKVTILIPSQYQVMAGAVTGE